MSTNSFLQSFENTFLLIIGLYKDSRKFQLIRWDSKGYFSAFNNPNDVYTFSCKYDSRKIEIFYNIPVIESSYFSNSQHFTEDEYAIITTYLASHEYGHTLFCDSTYTLKILLEQDITLPHGFNFIFLSLLFSEFSADFQARSIFPTNPEPLSSLFLNSHRFQEMLNNFYLYQFPWVNKPPDDPRLYDRYKFEFVELIRMFVFNQWAPIKQKYENHPIITFLNFCESLFTVFKDILIKTNRISLIRNYLIKLAAILDEISPKEVILGTIDKEKLYKIKFSSIQKNT